MVHKKVESVVYRIDAINDDGASLVDVTPLVAPSAPKHPTIEELLTDFKLYKKKMMEKLPGLHDRCDPMCVQTWEIDSLKGAIQLPCGRC